MSSAPLVPRPSAALSPATCLSRLARPLHDIEAMGDRVLYYIRVGAAKGTVSLRSLPPEVARHVAMLTLKRRTQTFDLQWFPNGEEAQVHVDLPISALPAAVDDLCQCGFAAQEPVRPPPAVPAPPPPPAAGLLGQ